MLTHAHAKGQGQRSLGSSYSGTNGQTDGGDCITRLTNVVGKKAEITKEAESLDANNKFILS